MKITLEVPEALGEQVLRLRERLPEILEYGLRRVTDEKSDNFSAVDECGDDPTALIASLKQYAHVGNYRAFVDRVKAIDWSTRQPEELAVTLDLALRLDISKLAQELAQLGARLFPDDLRLQQAARVLAPPVVSVYTPQAKGLAASRRWFREHAHQYKGQWVAVRGTDKGEVIMTSPAIDRHQDLSGFLKSVGRSFVEIHQLGVVRSAPFQMKLKHGREPDLLFIATEHLDRLKETYLDGPADLVVEIMSPESVGRDRGDKFYEYEAGGVPEYWLIDPQRRRFEAYGLETPGHYTLRFEGEKGRYASLHLPGFWLDVTWLWQDPLPHPLEVLGEIANVDATLMQQFMQALKGGSEQDAG